MPPIQPRTSTRHLGARALLLSLACLLLAGCEQGGEARTSDAAARTEAAADDRRPALDALDRPRAERRAARVSAVRYALDVDITDDEVFSGRQRLTFELSDASDDLTVDFSGGEIDAVEINGAASTVDYNGFFLTLPAAELRAGENVVRIDYRHPYSQDGTGLHRFVDPLDDRVYLYTYLWPYYANRLLPAFDQPNIKAELALTVVAPSEWVVVSTGTAEPEAIDDARSRWRFTTTPRMSTYVFSLHAGPYAQWEGDADGIPMRLFARRSLAEYVAAGEWLEVTRRGLAHYAEYFEVPYPYGKYDQLIVPDFAIGAMENIAAVTFTEGFVQRQESSATEREGRAGTILHEMAHMWFGDLVTHEWWNGLWLNESFATHMSAIATAETTEFDDVWHGFFTSDKRRAYRVDSRVTTHPIEVPVVSTADFFSVFDAITYQKGASVLKQLGYYVGAENYRSGVAAYLKAFAYDTTELDDFVSKQAASFGSPLDDWAQEWLYHAGLNAFRVEIACGSDGLESLAVLQDAPTPPDAPILRDHRTELSLYALDGEGALRLEAVVPAIVSGPRTEIALEDAGLDAAPCPVIVNPNHGDWAYARWVLNDTEAAAIEAHLGAVEDALERSMLLQALDDHARAGRMPLARYVGNAMRLAESEWNLRVQQQIADSVVNTVEQMQRLRPQTDAVLAALLPELERDLWSAMERADESDTRYAWLDAWLGVVATEAGQSRMRELLDGARTLPGLELSQDLRWRLLTRLAAFGPADLDALVAAEAEADGSDYGAKAALVVSAARPDATVKRAWLARLPDPDDALGMATRRRVASGMFPATQTDLAAEVQPEILASLPGVDAVADPYLMNTYARSLLPPVCTDASVARLAEAVASMAEDLGTTARRALREAQQAETECALLREVQ